MQLWEDDFGYTVNTHDILVCGDEDRPCSVHRPSPEAEKIGRRLWRGDRQLMERVCEHGTGHPDPDHMAYLSTVASENAVWTASVHGCDGCCGVVGNGPPPGGVYE